eukprot:16220857-Heterocapsa_arctica.AAC.1
MMSSCSRSSATVGGNGVSREVHNTLDPSCGRAMGSLRPGTLSSFPVWILQGFHGSPGQEVG